MSWVYLIRISAGRNNGFCFFKPWQATFILWNMRRYDVKHENIVQDDNSVVLAVRLSPNIIDLLYKGHYYQKQYWHVTRWVPKRDTTCQDTLWRLTRNTEQYTGTHLGTWQDTSWKMTRHAINMPSRTLTTARYMLWYMWQMRRTTCHTRYSCTYVQFMAERENSAFLLPL